MPNTDVQWRALPTKPSLRSVLVFCIFTAVPIAALFAYNAVLRSPHPEQVLPYILALLSEIIILFLLLHMRREHGKVVAEFDRFFTLSLDMFCIASKNGYFVQLNPIWERYLGFTVKEMLARPWMEFVYPDDVELVRAAAEELEQHDLIHFECRARHRAGGYRWLAVSASRWNEQGLTYAVARDITKEKEIDRAKSEFVSLAAHQLRTPLSSIEWYTEMLIAAREKPVPPEEAAEYLDEIQDASKRMAQLVNDLLNVSRIELGTLVVEPQPTNVVQLLETIAKGVSPLILRKKQTFEAQIAPKVLVLEIDPNLLRNMVENLLSNAIKYTEDGGNIRLRLEKRSRDILIAVQDDGCGIPESQQPQIFSKFPGPAHVRKEGDRSTGLGLYIVKAIAERTGCSVWFESKEGSGTTFFLAIPLEGMKRNDTKA